MVKPLVYVFTPTAIECGNYLRAVLDTDGYFFKTRLIGYVMMANDIYISVFRSYVDIYIMVLKGVDLSISCPSGDIGAIRFACHQGVFTFATCIERRFHCLFFNDCGWFSTSNEILLFDLPIYLNRDFDL